MRLAQGKGSRVIDGGFSSSQIDMRLPSRVLHLNLLYGWKRCRIAEGNSMGLIHEARSPNPNFQDLFFVFQSPCCVPCWCTSSDMRWYAAGSNQPDFILVQVMITK